MSKCFCHFNGYEVKDAKARPFKTIEELKSTTNLVDGNIVKTIGYHMANDGGGATYLIRTKVSSDIEDLGSIHFIGESLVAELIIDESVNVKTFGAKGDGLTDDTLSIQNAIDKCSVLNFDNKTYLVSGISLKSNSIVNFNKTTLKMIPNDKTLYHLIGVIEVENVSINGHVHLIGDKDLHTGTEGEFGMCLSIMASSNIHIDSVHCEYGWGDGLYIDSNSDITKHSNNVFINNVICNNNRRNGISICSGENIIINNIITYNNKGTAPNGGFDIEPWNANQKVKVSLGTVYSFDNGISPNYYQAFISNVYTDYYDVSIDKLIIDGVLSMNVTNEYSNVYIGELREKIQTGSNEVVALTNKGRTYIGNVYLDISDGTLTNRPIIYGDYIWNTYIDSLVIKNGGESSPYFCSAGSEITNLHIGRFNYEGKITSSSTRNCYIKIDKFDKKIRNITSTELRSIEPFDTVINISNEVTSINYNDIAEYDGYTFYITNNNIENACWFGLNLRKLLHNGSLASGISIPVNSVAKLRFDRLSGLYVVEYLSTLS